MRLSGNVRHLLVGVGVLSCLLLAGRIRAQDPRGSIIGQVADSTQAVIPGALVKAINDETQVSLTSTTNEEGNYSIPFLPPGKYTVTAESPGFKRYSRTGIQLRVSEVAQIDIRLELGAVTETVEVRSEAPLLDTSNAALGQVVDKRQIDELPMYAGNPMVELMLNSPGMVNPNSTMPSNHAAWNNVQAQSNGNGSRSNDFTIDGVSNTYPNGSSRGVRPAFAPPSAAVSEFKIETTSYDASVGHSIGASVNVVTKGGTNEFHGGAHWFLQNSALDTPTFFDNRNGREKANHQFNRYGFDVSGPVLLPGYNGRNKTFFFFTYEGNKWNIPEPRTDTVPGLAQRKGDLSDLLALGSEYQIYDPYSAVAADGRLNRSPFAGNIIPASLMDPVGVSIVSLFPNPNLPGTEDGFDNYHTPAVASEDYYTILGRVDHVFNESNRLFVRFQYDKWDEDQLRRLGDNNPASGVLTAARNKGGALDYVRVWSPSMVMNLRYGVTYQVRSDNRVSQGWDLAGLGFSPTLVGLIDSEFATIPDTRADGYARVSRFWDGDGSNTGLTHNVSLGFTKIQGKHNVKFGFSYRGYRSFGNRFPYSTSPYFRFRDTYTRGPIDTSGGSPQGQALAALLLGLPTEGFMESTPSFALGGPSAGLYLHDDFKLSRKLTLNLGLRWEYDLSVTERYDRLVDSFAGGVSNPIEAQAQANYAANPIPELAPADFQVLGGLTWVNQGGGRSPFERDRANFMPRIGLAYQLTPETVLRAGYGLFYDTVGVNQTVPIQTGYSQQTPVQVTRDGGASFVTTMSDPLPNGLIPPPGSSGGLTTNLGQDVSFYRSKRHTPYAQRWSVGVQRLLPMNFLLDATYVANRGTRLEIPRELNATPSQWLSREFFRDQATINFLGERFANPFQGTDPIYGSSITRADLLKPYPEFGSVTYDDGVGYSWYHSLQLRAEKRFSHGFTFQLAYTFSKLMQATEFLNASDAMPYETLSGSDRPHLVSVTGIWELPVGRGRRFGSGMPAALNAIIGDWQFGGIVRYQSGPPLEFGDAIFIGDIKDIALDSSERTVDKWFNTSAGFNRTSSQQRASNLRAFPLRFGHVRGDSQHRWDLSVRKLFRIQELMDLEFRAEAINAFNSPIFTAPNTTPTSSSFGRVTSTAWPGRKWQLGLKLQF